MKCSASNQTIHCTLSLAISYFKSKHCLSLQTKSCCEYDIEFSSSYICTLCLFVFHPCVSSSSVFAIKFVHAALDHLLRVFCTPIFYWSWWCKWNVFWVGLITSLCVIQNPFISLIMIMVNWHCMCKCSGRELTIGLLYLMYFEFNRWCWRSLLMCNLLERLTRKMKEWSFGMRLLSV